MAWAASLLSKPPAETAGAFVSSVLQGDLLSQIAVAADALEQAARDDDKASKKPPMPRSRQPKHQVRRLGEVKFVPGQHLAAFREWSLGLGLGEDQALNPEACQPGDGAAAAIVQVSCLCAQPPKTKTSPQNPKPFIILSHHHHLPEHRL